MVLQARSPHCFSDRYVLKLDGQAVGEFRGSFFSEGIDVRLLGRHQLRFQKRSWLGSQFKLIDASNAEVLAEATRTGVFVASWLLTLANGPAQLISAGIFTTGFHVVQNGQRQAEVNRIGACEGGWSVTGKPTLTTTDLLLIGLVYQTIVRRRAAANSS